MAVRPHRADTSQTGHVPIPHLSGRLPTTVGGCAFRPQDFPYPFAAAHSPAAAGQGVHKHQATSRLGVRRQPPKLRLVLVGVVHFDAQSTAR
ncbi:hypothetical protein SAMN05216499_10988 [Actinacidiphila paucisporea]|uniref:Uncharacterized protein n=1 Tax=Actinacidiphila paucisporea TaxID=310782 RepID=A0A1M7GVW5_9ACTN|nr:hypothetical protein SAMN05216499_10988 [Actinacidiphila paucisporea]